MNRIISDAAGSCAERKGTDVLRFPFSSCPFLRRSVYARRRFIHDRSGHVYGCLLSGWQSEEVVPLWKEAYDFFEQLDGYTDPNECISNLTKQQREALLHIFAENGLLEKPGWNQAGDMRYCRLIDLHSKEEYRELCIWLRALLKMLGPSVCCVGYLLLERIPRAAVTDMILAFLIVPFPLVLGSLITKYVYALAHGADPKAVVLLSGSERLFDLAADGYENNEQMEEAEEEVMDWLLLWSGIFILVPGGTAYLLSHACMCAWTLEVIRKEILRCFAQASGRKADDVISALKTVTAIVILLVIVMYY